MNCLLARKDCVTRLLLIGALIGLVFSNAEGISLLPFPDSPVSSHLLEDDGDRKTSYNLTVKPGRTATSKPNSMRDADAVSDNLAAAAPLTVRYMVRPELPSFPEIERPVFSYGREPRSTRGPPTV